MNTTWERVIYKTPTIDIYTFQRQAMSNLVIRNFKEDELMFLKVKIVDENLKSCAFYKAEHVELLQIA
jgi:hypothetical protein